MDKIVKLSPTIIAKIAAGEVIERPAYAVKELIENAIDAGATEVTVHIEDSGLRKIQVIDNGAGMNREDLEICFLPHTTSKLTSEDELIGIRTLGFRGEALSSIAAISNLTIQSRRKNTPSGTVIEIKQGKVDHIGPIGTPPGTIVTVENLFYSIPVRKKFLKTAPTEFRHITDCILHFSLAFPTIHFLLTHNNKTVIDLAKKENPSERLLVVFGHTHDNFLPISFTDSYVSVTGFIGKPQISSKNNQRQFIHINNRTVSDKLISLAVKESFGTLLPSSSTPVFTLSLSLPFEVVDVNVHPRKEQISFINSRLIFDLIKQAVSETLTNGNIAIRIDSFEETLRKGETTSISATTLKENVLPWNRTEIGKLEKNAEVLQIHQTYITTITKDGLVVFDQHAAHERILYEEFTDAFVNERKRRNTYVLPNSIKISVSLSEKQLIDEYKDIFSNMGFSLEHFGENTFVIRQIPILFKGRNIEKILKDMLGDLSEDMAIKTIDTASRKMLAFLSCRAAVKSGDMLSSSQMKNILKNLEKSENNATCPHGRPTRILFSLPALHKYFKRI